MTKSFLCYYTGKDGVTPRCRTQTLIRFDRLDFLSAKHIITPLWAEVINSRTNHKHHFFMLHAQLSDSIAVYTEVYLTDGMINLLEYQSVPDNFRDMCDSMRAVLIQCFDFTSYLLNNPYKISPSMINAYRDSNLPMFNQLNTMFYSFNK